MSRIEQIKKNMKAKYNTLVSQIENDGKTNYEKDSRLWKPEVDKSGSGFAVIRFLPTPTSDKSDYVKIYSHQFKVGGRWFIENCPTTLGDSCYVCSKNSELWNTETKENQEIVRQRKRKTKYIANILVISDPKNKANEGKVFLFEFGTKIFEKITTAINPEFDDEASFNPFDPFDGADFKLKIRNYEGYRNYDKSEFSSCSPLFDDDHDLLEKVLDSTYSLKEFIDPKLFKSEAELAKKFIAVIGSGQSEVKAPQAQYQEPVQTEARRAPKSEVPFDTSDDEDFAMLSSLIDD